MTVQHIARILLHHNVDCIEQTSEVSFYNERCADVGHDEIAHKEHA